MRERQDVEIALHSPLATEVGDRPAVVGVGHLHDQFVVKLGAVPADPVSGDDQVVPGAQQSIVEVTQVPEVGEILDHSWG